MNQVVYKYLEIVMMGSLKLELSYLLAHRLEAEYTLPWFETTTTEPNMHVYS